MVDYTKEEIDEEMVGWSVALNMIATSVSLETLTELRRRFIASFDKALAEKRDFEDAMKIVKAKREENTNANEPE